MNTEKQYKLRVELDYISINFSVFSGVWLKIWSNHLSLKSNFYKDLEGVLEWEEYKKNTDKERESESKWCKTKTRMTLSLSFSFCFCDLVRIKVPY